MPGFACLHLIFSQNKINLVDLMAICSKWSVSQTNCISDVCLLHQTSMNGCTHATNHKKKLWNSLELSNTLIVENVTVDHTGEYTCTASSGQMEKSASAFLKVYGRCSENIILL